MSLIAEIISGNNRAYKEQYLKMLIDRDIGFSGTKNPRQHNGEMEDMINNRADIHSLATHLGISI